MIAASEARAILARQYEALFGTPPNAAALRLLLAQSRGEGEWGDLGGYDAEGRYWEFNWGGVQSKHAPPCPFGTFQHGDSKPTVNGQVPFQWCFQGYLTNDDGARDFLKHALVHRKAAHAAVKTGDVRAYAEALYGDGSAPYYGGFGATRAARIQSYVDFLSGQLAIVDRALGAAPTNEPAGEPTIDYQPPYASSRARPAVLPVALAAALAAYLISR